MGEKCSDAVCNFGAGPGKLPVEVLKHVQDELLSFGDTKVSITELSHRCREFDKIVNDAQSTVRDLLEIPSNYKILFMQGGGTGLFAAIPLNFMNKTGTADYIVTGSWSAKAVKEAEKFGKVNLVLPKRSEYTEIPDPSTWNLDPQASYVYYCDNETIHGIEFNFIPETNSIPLVVDMSSNILTKKFDVSKYGLIFAGAQKNIGPSGITLVIVREDLIGHAAPMCPSILDFAITAKDNSIHNTPPTFQIYVVGLVFQWIKKNGGLKNMERLALEKSKMIYGIIDNSNGFYFCPLKKDCRSRMNVTFRIAQGDEKLEKEFLDGAGKCNMLQLKGHRSVGGIRASLYNAVTLAETQFLADYMKSFRNSHAN